MVGCGGEVRHVGDDVSGEHHGGGNGGGMTGAPETILPGSGVPENVLPELGWSLRDDTPAGRFGAAAVMDTAGDRLIVVGKGSDAWSLPLSGPHERQWLRLRAEGERPPADAMAAVYDPVGDRLLALTAHYQDELPLWELSLSGTPEWRRVQNVGPPPGQELAGAQLTLDTDGNRLFAVSSVHPRAWMLPLEAGAEWTPLAELPATAGLFAGELGGSLLAFDAPRQRLVAFGLNEVWQLPLESGEWSSLGRDPCVRFLSTGIFDFANERVIYVGGECGGTWTFSLEDDAWQQRTSPDRSGPLMTAAAAALDAERGRVLYLFADAITTFEESSSNATWQLSLDSLTLQMLTPNTRGASVASRSVAVWDPVRQAVVAFGGTGGVHTVSHALEPSATWQQLPGASGASEYISGAVYDPRSSSIVVLDSSHLPAGDMAVRSLGSGPGATWQDLPVPPGPRARAGNLRVYDSARGRLVIHGGVRDPRYRDGGELLGDTWALSLNGDWSWTELSVLGTGPLPSERVIGAYDAAGERAIVYTGHNGANDPHALYALSLKENPAWSVLEPSGNPPDLHAPSIVYDAEGRRLIFVDVTYFGVVVAALELGSEPAWHTFCPLGTLPAPGLWMTTVLAVPDGIFIGGPRSEFRFDLATPYCD